MTSIHESFNFYWSSIFHISKLQKNVKIEIKSATNCLINIHQILGSERLELDFIIIKSGLSLIQTMSYNMVHILDKFFRNVKSRIYILP